MLTRFLSMSESINAENTETAQAVRELVVNGVRYNNSAAKFWPTFLNEIRRRSPDTDRVVMGAHGDGPLTPRMLVPEQTLSESLERMDPSMDFHSAMQGIAAELEVAGPPAAVSLSMFHGDTLIGTEALTEFLDSDVFPFLLVWLLEWSCFSESAWNRTYLRGAFSGDDPLNSVRYRFRFSLRNKHLSEGLYQRSLSMQWQRTGVTLEAPSAS